MDYTDVLDAVQARDATHLSVVPHGHPLADSAAVLAGEYAPRGAFDTELLRHSSSAPLPPRLRMRCRRKEFDTTATYYLLLSTY